MPDENATSFSTNLGQLLATVPTSTWLGLAAKAWRALRKTWNGLVDEGIYEVLDCEAVLELKDKRGERALVRKHQRVRFLQNSVIAFQDQAWGDGDILINYRCAPGVPVDRYRPGRKTYILISLREVKNRGDEEEFDMQWEMHHSFTRSTELWSAEVSHRMRHLKLQVTFPRARPPIRVVVVEDTTQKITPLPPDAMRQLPDGRFTAAWETDRPQLYETYGLRWDW